MSTMQMRREESNKTIIIKKYYAPPEAHPHNSCKSIFQIKKIPLPLHPNHLHQTLLHPLQKLWQYFPSYISLPLSSPRLAFQGNQICNALSCRKRSIQLLIGSLSWPVVHHLALPSLHHEPPLMHCQGCLVGCPKSSGPLHWASGR